MITRYVLPLLAIVAFVFAAKQMHRDRKCMSGSEDEIGGGWGIRAQRN